MRKSSGTPPLCVADTNVLVSALLSAKGAPNAVMAAMLDGLWIPTHNDRILAEYRRVLAEPDFGFDPDAVDDVLTAILRLGEYVRPKPWPWPHKLPDPTDAVFLATASASDALVITGNAKHYPATARRNVHVVSPREFVLMFL